jgi:hypothetical protein
VDLPEPRDEVELLPDLATDSDGHQATVVMIKVDRLVSQIGKQDAEVDRRKRLK